MDLINVKVLRMPWLFGLCFILSWGRSSTIIIDLKVGERRCLMEGVRSGELLLGEYSVSMSPQLVAEPGDAGAVLSYSLLDSGQNVLDRRTGLEGKGRFTAVTDRDDVLEICFESHSTDIRAPRPGESSAEAAHEIRLKLEAMPANASQEAAVLLEPVGRQLSDCERLAAAAISDFQRMRRREAEMSDTNLSTSNRLFYIGLFILLLLTASASWQLLYLRSYFKSRRLI